ncbi:MAG: DNA-binding PadR family transcriptional regulator [Pseudohongiellaceae bacterium]|jgi:DNA-binding PadR family transcriptional regulator
MSLKHVILAVLQKGSASGYEINQTFEGPLGIYWNTSHQRVYRALAALRNDGWVDFEHHSQAGKPDKKAYDLTPEGEQELQQWLIDFQPVAPINESLMVKFFAGDFCPTESLLAQMKTLQKQHQKKLTNYLADAEIVKEVVDQMPLEDRRGYLTLRKGILMEQARLSWCEEAIIMLEQDLAD